MMITLNQRGLATRLDRSTSWVRRQGKWVKGFNRNGVNYGGRTWTEVWERTEYQSGRLSGYKRRC